VIDSQSVKADAVVGSDSRGFDGGDKASPSHHMGTCDFGFAALDADDASSAGIARSVRA
jgi:hypothetical protein